MSSLTLSRSDRVFEELDEVVAAYTRFYPSTPPLVLIAHQLIDEHNAFAGETYCKFRHFHPYKQQYTPKTVRRHVKERYEHLFRSETPWAAVVFWAPELLSGRPNTTVWGYIHIPTLLGHQLDTFKWIHKNHCVRQLPPICSSNPSPLFHRPLSETTLPEIDQALRSRLDLYLKIRVWLNKPYEQRRKAHALTLSEGSLLTEEDVDRDARALHILLYVLNISQPRLIPGRATHAQWLEIMDEVVRYEMVLLRHHLRVSCLSHHIATLCFSRLEAVPVEGHPSFPVPDLVDKEQHLDLANSACWLRKGYPTPQQWWKCDLFHPKNAVVWDLVRQHHVVVRGGEAFLHIGHAQFLLEHALGKQIIEETAVRSYRESVIGNQRPDERLLAIARGCQEQLAVLWGRVQLTKPELVESIGSFAALKEVSPPCVKRMIQAVLYPTPTSTLPEMDHNSRTIFYVIALRSGIPKKDLIRAMDNRVRIVYPSDRWKEIREEIRIQVASLLNKRYFYGCSSLLEPHKQWCVYGKHECAQKACQAHSDVPADIPLNSPWTFIVHRYQRRHLTVRMEP
jgi:hypothetical protein